MFPDKQELRLKNRINNNTKSIYEFIADTIYNQKLELDQVQFDDLLNEHVNQLIDDLVKSTVEFASFSQEEWEKVLKGDVPSPLHASDTEKWLLSNLETYKSTPDKAIDKLENIRYTRIEGFRKELNSRFELSLDTKDLRDIRYIEAQLKNTAFDFKEWEGLRTDIKNLDKFSKEDLEGLKKWFYRRNELWARNQAGNLYAMQSEELAILTGIEKFRWVTERDSRVRKTHVNLDGKILEFDRVEFLPGQEPLCRCHLEPIPNKNS